MANEVEIRITAHDLTGPAFASVMAKIAAVKAAMDDAFRDRHLDLDISGALAKIEMLKRAADGINFGHIDMSDLNTGLMALRSKMQSLGIADIADIDVQPGRLMTQLQLIKRLISQSGISDVLDFNLTPANLAAQLDKLGHVAYDIPVRFDMSRMPQLGKIGTEHVPITFDYGRIVGPHMPVLNVPANVIIKDFVQHGVTMPVLDVPANIDIKDIPKVGPTMPTIHIPATIDFKNIPTSGDVEVIKRTEEATTGLGYAAGFLGQQTVKADQAFSPFLMNILKMADDSRKASQYNAGLGDILGIMAAGAIRAGTAIGGGFLNAVRAMGGAVGGAYNAVRGLAGAIGGGGVGGGGAGGGGGGGGGNLLGAFGGWGNVLNRNIGGIRLWHVAMDGAMEAAVALGTAVVSLSVGLAAMAPAAMDIYTHLQAIATVNQALGSSIPPLTGQFQDLANSLKGQTIEAYGGALNFLNQGAGGLARTAREVVTGIDDMIARLDLWRSSQQSTGKVLETGVQFLHQFEGILGSVAGAISHLVQADPGTAHFLMNVVGAGAKLLDVVTSLPTPILYTALALHSMYLWGNVAAGALGAIISKIPGLQSLGSVISHGFHFNMLSNPYVAVTAGVIALGAAFAYLAVQGDMATNQVRGDINATNAALSQMNASQAIGALITDITRYQVASANAFSPAALQNINATTGSIQMMGSETDVSMGHMANALHDIGLQQWGSAAKGVFDSVTALFDKNAAVTHIAENNASAYNAEIQKLTGSQANLYGESGKLMTQGFSLAQSFALMDMAGVKFNDTSALMQQKVKNLITGYQNMSVSGNLLASSVNAVTFASLQQQSGIQKITSGFTAFFSMVTSGGTTFNSFANQIVGLYQSMSDGSVKLSDSGGKVSASLKLVADQASGTKVSMNGLNTASITAQQTFIQTAQAAQTNLNALMTMASAAGLGTKGTDMLTKATTDYVQLLAPAAKGSTEMTSILWALAQQGGLTADQFKSLLNGVDGVKNPMKDLQGITTTLTQDSAGLTQDVQNLSTALGSTLNSAMAQVIFTESGGIGPMNALARAIDQTGLNSRSTASAADNVASQFGRMTGSVNSAYGEFMTFATQALGLTRSQADALWRQSLPSVQAAIDRLHGKSVSITANTSQATSSINQVQTYLNGLKNRTVYVTVAQQVQVQSTIPVRGGIGGGALRAVGGIAGNVPHAASGGVRNGLTLVGELGPELVRLPAGSQVYPNGVTPGYASQGGSEGWPGIQLEVTSGGSSAFEAFMLEAIRNWVRLKGGGNVQKAFGRN
jgi:hypothetical protein